MTTSTPNNTSSGDSACRCDRNCGCCKRKELAAAAKPAPGFFRKRPWLWVLLAFVLLFSAWTAFFYIAWHNQPQTIVIDH